MNMPLMVLLAGTEQGHPLILHFAGFAQRSDGGRRALVVQSLRFIFRPHSFSLPPLIRRNASQADCRLRLMTGHGHRLSPSTPHTYNMMGAPQTSANRLSSQDFDIRHYSLVMLPLILRALSIHHTSALHVEGSGRCTSATHRMVTISRHRQDAKLLNKIGLRLS